jgi:type VI secretion system protein ImpK
MRNDGSRGGDRTVLRPTPGGRRRDVPATPPPPRHGPPAEPASAHTAEQHIPLVRSDRSDGNPLTAAAGPLLALASKLRTALSHPDSSELFRNLAEEVRRFESAANQAGAAPEVVLAARYSLCTLLDEVVLNTPWGSQSVWVNQTLLNLFHKEGWGGEKFFQIVERVIQQPANNLDLLELLYLCMALGLEGKYRVQAGGRSQLETLQLNVATAIRRQRGEFERELSPHWRGVQDLRPALARYVPLWVVCAAGLAVALFTYFGFLIVLNQRSDPVAIETAALGADLPQLVERQGYVPPPRALTLKDLLAAEASQGLLEVTESAGKETVILREGLFPSGSGEVDPERRALLQTIAAALNRIPGAVLISGHTDDRPIGRSIRFPSNWHLSKRRAEAVTEILAQQVDPSRLTAEARGESEPLVPNDTPANRALNRRVEIALFALPSRD